MDLFNPQLYFNRELSWLEFNERVLEEAQDKTNPLMERLKFLAISASNLDEFFMVRVSSLWEQASASVSPDPSGLTPVRQLEAIHARVHEMVNKQYNCWTRSILPALERERIFLLTYDALSEAQRAFVLRYFDSTIYPVLTPTAIDKSRPFPLLNNRTLNVVAELTENANEPLFAVVQVPTVLPRVLPLPTDEPGRFDYILLEHIVMEHVQRLFEGYTVLRASLFRITRNSDLDIDEEEMDDLLVEMERSIKRRRWGDPVRLEIAKPMHKHAQKFLVEALELDPADVYEINGPLDLSVWMSFSGADAFAYLRNKPQPPIPADIFLDAPSIIDVIRERDVLVHHPYNAFDCVVQFICEAADDPQVLAIKQTLYRVSGQSAVVGALMRAAGNGKQVTVLVELKARFDEENNINWARKLEQAGCHVVYGLVGLKTHCKVCLVVRQEDDGIRRYIHYGTGNYNDATAKIYTDVGLFTCKETFCQDGSVLFNVLTGYSKTTDWHKIAVAPVSLRPAFLRLIETETRNAQEGKKALIIAKMNSLSDVEMIQALYRASMAGVVITLIVRGICCLKAGVPGVSDNITVSSVVDRYLEHSRIFYFENDGHNRMFISSADWMSRNLDRRVETLIPVEEPALKARLMEILETSSSDNVKRRVLQPDGSYVKPDRRGGKPALRSQAVFYARAAARYAAAREAVKKEVFRPVYKREEGKS